MKVRFFAAAALAAVLAVAASTASARPGSPSGANRAAASKITVWLQVDAQTGWPDLVAAANQQFHAKHPGTTVDVALPAERQVDVAEIGPRPDGEDPHACTPFEPRPPGPMAWTGAPAG